MRRLYKIAIATITLAMTISSANAAGIDFTRTDLLSSPKDRVSISITKNASPHLPDNAFTRVDSLRSNNDLNSGKIDISNKISADAFLKTNELRRRKDVF